MESLTTLISSAALAAALISIFYIYRCTQAINSVYGIFAVAIFAFALWAWYKDCILPVHATDSAESLLIILAVFMNILYTRHNRKNYRIERRVKQVPEYTSNQERRKHPHAY